MNEILDTLAAIDGAAADMGRKVGDAGDDAARSDLTKILAASNKLAMYVKGLESADEPPTDLATLRHKLRTPINQILGYCELMMEEAADAGGATWDAELSAIHGNARRLTGLVDAVLERAETASQSSTSLQREATAGGGPERGASILVVDDNDMNRDMLSRRLKRAGHFVLEAGDGKEALEVATHVQVDLVLLDIMMPVMDGYQTLAEFKRRERLRHIPVIMLSSLDEPESITRCIELGAEDHLPKPFDPVLLRARIGASIEKKQLHDREVRYRERIEREKKRADDLLNVVIPLGVALTGERDYDRMLERIVIETRELCNADGAALFLRRDDERLHLVALECESIGLSLRGSEAGVEPVQLSTSGDGMPLVRAVESRECVHVPLVAALPSSSHIRDFDEQYDYQTHSVLVVPLAIGSGRVLGALQLWNVRDMQHGTIGPFDDSLIQLVASMSSLAGSALDSYARMAQLERRIEDLEIQIDSAKQAEQVADITETEYFRNLREKARSLRKRGG
jgi:CheY-like chemotaxis protein